MLELSNLNYLAIFIVWLVNVAVGSLWYSPALFAKRWTKLSGVDLLKLPKDEANRAIGSVAASALVQAFALAIIINTIDADTLVEGLTAGLLLWVGFTAATTVGVTLYSRKSWSFWWLNAAYFLVVLPINSVILSLWQQ